ncbi:conserved membrane hypothetical protein [Burkholderiales bacterium 8X]|nr:conserved membrane hypothetical protein [Burkholderiales bacterium 8X]
MRNCSFFSVWNAYSHLYREANWQVLPAPSKIDDVDWDRPCGRCAQMKAFKRDSLAVKMLWASGSYGMIMVLRFCSSVIIARLLAPELVGVMVIVNSVRMGVELLTDVGIEQNIVRSKRGDEREFFNTAWTIQVLRGVLLTALFSSISPLISKVYGIDSRIFFFISAAPLITGLGSTSIFLLVKNLRVRERNVFELKVELLNFFIAITIIFIWPTIWSLVAATLSSLAIRAGLSYSLPHPKHRFCLDRSSMNEIVSFGKWTMATSLVSFSAANLDKIYLGTVVSLSIMGVFGIARSISDLPGTLASRIGYQVIFPAAAASGKANSELSRLRLLLVCVAAVAIGTVVNWADLAINTLYGSNYKDGGKILQILLFGAWFSVLSSFSEATLLGRGRAAAITFANIFRLLGMLVTIPVGFSLYGLTGALYGIVASEFLRFVALAIFEIAAAGVTDLVISIAATALMAVTITTWTFLRTV